MKFIELPLKESQKMTLVNVDHIVAVTPHFKDLEGSTAVMLTTSDITSVCDEALWIKLPYEEVVKLLMHLNAVVNRIERVDGGES